MTDFERESDLRLEQVRSNVQLRDLANRFMASSISANYSYNFWWQGRPIIQYPQDIVGFQELVWSVKPDLIIETGIAHGGSLVLSASLLTLLEYADADSHGQVLDPRSPRRRVLGIDIDIRPHNRAAIQAHPMSSRIEMIEGSSIDPKIISSVAETASGFSRVMVCLDSNHTHEHVLAELRAYAPLVSPGSYCVVFDTIVEDVPEGLGPERPWNVGNNPKTAIREFMNECRDFVIDDAMDAKLLISVAPSGYLRRL